MVFPVSIGLAKSTFLAFFSRRYFLSAGFGFIWDNVPGEIGDVDIFVHWTTIQGDAQFKTLAEGEMVEYELGRGPKVGVHAPLSLD